MKIPLQTVTELKQIDRKPVKNGHTKEIRKNKIIVRTRSRTPTTMADETGDLWKSFISSSTCTSNVTISKVIIDETGDFLCEKIRK